jgi:methyl-accepting chemotaxis protein-1 (serine sensor receptor)
MNLNDMKIAARLGLLGVLFAVALLVVGGGGWRALNASTARSQAALERSGVVTDTVDAARSAQVQFKIQVQEWKDTLLRGNDQAQFDKYSAAFKKAAEKVKAEIAKTRTLMAQLGMPTAKLDELQAAMDELNKNYLEALQQYDVAKPDSAHVVDTLVKGKDRAPTAKINELVDDVQKFDAVNRAAVAKEQEAAKRDTVMMLAAVVLGTIAVGAAIMIWIVRTITTPLNEAVEIAQVVASGDLSTEVYVHGNDEIGVLMKALKEMHDNLADIVGRVRAGADSIAHSSAEVAAESMELSTRTEEQASALEETASSMQQLTQTVASNNENAHTASKLAGSASDVAVRGGEAVAQVVATMDSINESSKKIVDIIGVIDGIAFQTNILALNAAVEAARAGEQGRGFAVVASEVRSLAQRSASAAKEIKELISDSVGKVDTGTRLVGQAGSTMDDVVDSVRRVTAIISEIAQASDEQNSGIGQINDSVAQMDTMTQQNAALVEEAAAAAESMQQQARELQQAVSVFKIDPARIRSLVKPPAQGRAVVRPQLRAVRRPAVRTEPVAENFEA